MFDQQRNILLTLPQGRHRQLDHVQPVVEVAAEGSLRHHILKIFIGRRQHPHVHPGGFGASHSLELPFLKHPQQFDLKMLGQFPDLIEKDGAAIRRFKQAGFLRHCAGKSTAHVAEQLAFQQIVRNCPAVYHFEGPVGAGAEIVDRPGHQFLAGAALAIDQHRDVGTGNARDHLEDTLHLRSIADDPGKLVAFLALMPAEKGIHLRIDPAFDLPLRFLAFGLVETDGVFDIFMGVEVKIVVAFELFKIERAFRTVEDQPGQSFFPFHDLPDPFSADPVRSGGINNHDIASRRQGGQSGGNVQRTVVGGSPLRHQLLLAAQEGEFFTSGLT